MRAKSCLNAILALSVTFAGCARLPDMPNRDELPIDEILHHALCELYDAFYKLRDKHPSFGADRWSIGITITPKIDQTTTVRAGIGRKSSTTAKRVLSWTLGTPPGAGYEAKGHKDATIAYNISSANLLKEAQYGPSECVDAQSAGRMALAKHLGVGDWLLRVVEADDAESDAVTLQNSSFAAQIVITHDGAAGLTYIVPLGSEFGSVSAKRVADETVSFQFTRSTPPPRPVVTLPHGQKFSPRAAAGVSPEAADELELLRLQQTLRNLQLTPQ